MIASCTEYPTAWVFGYNTRASLTGDFTAGLRYGQALAALALRTDGDIVVVTPDELDELVAGSGPRPQR